MNMLPAVVGISVGLMLGCSQSSPTMETQPEVRTIAATFNKYRKMTKEMVFVNPGLAAKCAPVSKEELEAAREKTGPHANTGIVIYMNELAANAFLLKSNAYPEGAVIVKEKKILGYMENDGKGVSDGVGGMIKRSAGYDPEYGDWEYFYFDDATKIESGRIASCVQCHSSARGKDFVFGSWERAKQVKQR